MTTYSKKTSLYTGGNDSLITELAYSLQLITQIRLTTFHDFQMTFMSLSYVPQNWTFYNVKK